MSLSIWQRGDLLPALPPLAGFRVEAAPEAGALAQLAGLDRQEVQRRWQEGHRAYVGYVDDAPAAYGWAATRRAGIGELKLDFALPPRCRYLWDFATLPPWRGRGLYPRLLQAIVRQEMAHADTFWIIRAPENGASGSGMRKAGFTPVGRLSLRADGLTALLPTGDPARARAGAALLGVPLVSAGIFACWHCGGAAYPAAAHADECACGHTLPESESCVCAA